MGQTNRCNRKVGREPNNNGGVKGWRDVREGTEGGMEEGDEGEKTG